MASGRSGLTIGVIQKIRLQKKGVGRRGVINGKAGKAAALHKFLDMLTLSRPGALPHLKKFSDYSGLELGI